MLNFGTLGSNGLLSLNEFDDPIAGYAAIYPIPAHTTTDAPIAASSSNDVTGTSAIVEADATVPQSEQTSLFVIDIGLDPSISNLASSSPTLYSEITGAIDVAVQFYETEIVNPITISIDFGFGEVGGNTLGAGDLGESLTELSGPYNYSSVVNALSVAATSADDATAVASLGTSDPTKGGNLEIAVAEAEALGMMGVGTSDFAGNVGISNTASFDYNPNNRAVSGESDAIGVLEHEISEVMGRIALLGETVGTITHAYTPLDLFQFSNTGTRQLVAGHTAYFSINDGTTDLANFNTVASGDAGDWASSVTHDAYDAFSSSGVANTVSATDLHVMDVLGYELAPACFVAGTCIRTVRGYVPVEDLNVDDIVYTQLAGPAPISWIGHRHIDCQRHPDPRQVWPVRIAANAFGPGQPRRDVLLSSDHAVRIGGHLVVIRRLLNGATIRQELDTPEVTYFHIELQQHDILDAEGLAAESYLDTGNRGLFANSDQPRVLHPQMTVDAQLDRERRSCLPLLTDPASVEKIWRALCPEIAVPAPETTAEPDLRVVIDGRSLPPVVMDGLRYTFVVPSMPVRLRSRAAVPSDRRPWTDEHRRLGVMVQRILLRHDADWIDLAMDDPRLTDGWWAVERDETTIWRWTNGDALLPLTLQAPAILQVTIGDTAQYPPSSAEEMIRNAA